MLCYDALILYGSCAMLMLAKLCYAAFMLRYAMCAVLWAARYYLRCGCMGSACGYGLVPCAVFQAVKLCPRL
jgi:hypothetical protein